MITSTRQERSDHPEYSNSITRWSMAAEGKSWFLIPKAGERATAEGFCAGCCSWTENLEGFEIWVHIDADDYGYVKGRSEDVPQETLLEIYRQCLDYDRTLSVMCEGAHVELLGQELRLPLDLQEDTLDMEEMYHETMMELFQKTKKWESDIGEAQERALAILENSRNGIIEEINARNRRIRQLETELQLLKGAEQQRARAPATATATASVLPLSSPVKSEATEASLAPGLSAQQRDTYPFIGINTVRSSSSPQKLPSRREAAKDVGSDSDTDTDIGT